jgi:VPDSG-CTERM motif
MVGILNFGFGTLLASMICNGGPMALPHASLGLPPLGNTNHQKIMKRTKLSTIIGAVALITAPFAAAVPTLYYDAGSNGIDYTVADGGLGDAAPLTGGAVIAIFADGNWNVLTTATTKPVTGSAGNPQLSSTNLTFSGTGEITIYFAESGFGPSSSNFRAELSSSSLADDATVSYSTYSTTGAVNLAALGAAMTSQTIIGGLGAGPAFGVLTVAGTGPYNLIQKLVINQPTGGNVTVTANLRSVPDGGTTLALLGASLLGLGAVRRKMMK